MTVVHSAECAAPKAPSQPAAMLPLLVILFVVSYSILTMLVFEQGMTIESQRSLIHEMLKDSTQLAVFKGRQARDDSNRPHEKASVAPEHKDEDSSSPSAGAKGPDGKKLDKDTKRPGKSTRSMQHGPEKKPAGELEDVRRSTRLI